MTINFGGVPCGAVDGVNTTFTMMAIPSSMFSLFVYKNGVFQQPSKDYTFKCNQITFTQPPQEGDDLYVQGATA